MIMKRDDICKELTQIFIDVLDNENIVLNYITTANDIEEWDSLAHIHLVVAIEKHFKIRFSTKEIQTWENVGNLIESISSKI